jgi:hypothetical protein
MGLVISRSRLELYVMSGCVACERAELTLRACERLAGMVDVVVLELGAPGVKPPAAVVGGPTTVFNGAVVALGTPDCEELADRIEGLVADGARGLSSWQ